MPARSEAQQRLMGMALASKRGKGHYSGKVKELADSMSEKQLRDFAKTKHEGLPEKKANIVEALKFKMADIAAQSPVPTETQQQAQLDKYLNLPNVDQKPSILENRYSPSFTEGSRLGATTPAAAISGVYGKNSGAEIAAANDYNKQNNYPVIGRNILKPTGVYSHSDNSTYPAVPISNISKNPLLSSEITDPENLVLSNIFNGFQPVKPGVNISNVPNKPNYTQIFSDKPQQPVMPMNEIIEHEIGGHRVYDNGEDASKRMPITMRWPSSVVGDFVVGGKKDPYQRYPGEAVNGLAAIQRDQFMNNGARYTDPAAFTKDVNSVLSSPDVEKAMTDKGWNRIDSRRLIRGMLPMEQSKRNQYIEQSSRAIPGVVRNNPAGSNIKTSEEKQSIVDAVSYLLNKRAFHPQMISESLPREDIVSGVDSIRDYFGRSPTESFTNSNDSDSSGLIMPAALSAYYGARLLQMMKERKREQEYEQARTHRRIR